MSSSANVKVIQISSRSNPSEILEIKGAGVKETSFTISNITKSAAWEAANFGVNDLRTKIGFKPLQIVSFQNILDYFAPLMAATVDIFNVEEGTFYTGAVAVSPSAVSKSKSGGATQQFTVATLPAAAAQAVVWSIAPASGLSINQSGLVTIGSGVTNGAYNVTATSVADPTKSSTAVLTVTT